MNKNFKDEKNLIGAICFNEAGKQVDWIDPVMYVDDILTPDIAINNGYCTYKLRDLNDETYRIEVGQLDADGNFVGTSNVVYDQNEVTCDFAKEDSSLESWMLAEQDY